MVANRRFGPLIIAVCLGILVLVVRMYQVQIVEHDVWAREATNLGRSSTTVPYLRGPITDRNGELFVMDVEACAIEFVYRDFRRKHPLGQVAHARGALERASVPLDAAALHLEQWAFELIESRPIDLDAFEDGEALMLCGVEVPFVGKGASARESRRRSRAGDLRYYIRGLLDVDKYEWSDIKKRLKKKGQRQLSWIQLAAVVQKVSLENKRKTLAKRFEDSLGLLEQLAGDLHVSGAEGELAVSSTQSFWFLVDALERKRQDVEDEIAVDLFRAAAGFHPGRVEPHVLLASVDLEWLASISGWDEARLARWARGCREAWLSNWRTFHLPGALIRAELDRKNGAAPLEALVGELSLLFTRRPRTERERRTQNRSWYAWRQRDDLAVFHELGDLFEAVEFPALAGSASVPCADPEVRSSLATSAGVPVGLIPLEFAGVVAETRPLPEMLDWRGDLLEPWRAPADFEEASERLERLYAWRGRTRNTDSIEWVPRRRPDYLDEQELLPWIAELWQAQFQERLVERLSAPQENADGVAIEWPIKLAKRRLKAAGQAADYAIRDRSSRPEILHDDPEEAVVHLLLRFRGDFGGFAILPRTKRLAMAHDEDGVFVAQHLIGEVRESTLAEVIEQQGPRSDFSRILTQRKRSDADVAEFNDLVEQLSRNDELHGSSGVEGLCDEALTGVNGFVENIGLQEREDAGGQPLSTQKIDGVEVQLTLDIELQKAAQDVIEHPVLPSGEDQRDDVWFRNPVGAIVLATVDGEILVAASGPKEPHQANEVRDGERAFSYDRCFHRRQFQPIGSIFKPFVAAYAIDRLGLTAETVLPCERIEALRSGGWGSVSCGASWGHGDITLAPALEKSCNAYFAQLGELYQTRERIMEMTRLFGFDAPTGVTSVAEGRGFGEHSRIPRFANEASFSLREKHLAGNGLQVIEASPVQVARAAAGLATGELPGMRLVRAVDGQRVPPSYERLPISEEAFALVRSAMRGVITTGTAKDKGLGTRTLGFDLAGKTGSADTLAMSDDFRAQLRMPRDKSPSMRKHTWFMGYFPADDPQAVVVVFLNDVGVTASHSAVHVAAQFLRSPAVQRFAKELER